MLHVKLAMNDESVISEKKMFRLKHEYQKTFRAALKTNLQSLGKGSKKRPCTRPLLLWGGRRKFHFNFNFIVTPRPLFSLLSPAKSVIIICLASDCSLSCPALSVDIGNNALKMKRMMILADGGHDKDVAVQEYSSDH